MGREAPRASFPRTAMRLRRDDGWRVNTVYLLAVPNGRSSLARETHTRALASFLGLDLAIARRRVRD